MVSGGRYNEFLTPNASILVCNTSLPAAEKIKYAVEWKVPIVSSKWLWDSIQEGQLKSLDPYLIGRPEYNISLANSKASGDRTELTEAETHGNPLTRVTKGTEKRLLLGRTLDLVKTGDTPQLIDSLGSRIIEESPIKNKTSCLDSIGTLELHSKIDSPNPDECDNNSAHPSRLLSAPLKEISFNSSPKASPSPTKVLSPSKSATHVKVDHGDSLGPAISSLLAHHQRLTTTNPPAKTTDDPSFGRQRRRRQLLGRAASSMSARSNGSIGMSRASSVDTMNTDGVGTPLESSTANTREELDESFASLYSFGEQERFRETVEQPPQMTQLSYEDPDVRAWRERVVKKLGGVGQIEPDVGKRAEGIGVVTDVGGRGAKGVGRRTRQALGR
jgi:DNA replication regulator DPB11